MKKSFLDKNNNFIDVPEILGCSIVDLKYHLNDLRQKCISKIKEENSNFDDSLRFCLDILLFPKNLDDYIKCYFDQLTKTYPFLLTIRNQEEIIDSIEPKYKSEFYTMLLDYKFSKSLQQFNDSVKQIKNSITLFNGSEQKEPTNNNVTSFEENKRVRLLEVYEQFDADQLQIILDGKQESLRRLMQECKNPQIVEIIHNIEALDTAIKNPKTDMDKQKRNLYIARKEMLSRTVEVLMLKYPISLRDNNIMSLYEEITIIQNILATKNKKSSRAQ